MRQGFLPFLVWFLLGGLGLVAVGLGLDLTGLARMAVLPDLPETGLRAVLMVQPAVLLAIGIAIGVALADRVGLVSLVTQAVRGSSAPVPGFRSFGRAGGAGVIVGLGVAVADRLLAPLTGLAAGNDLPGLAGMAQALLYGGIGEELMMRYGLVTLLVWLGAKLLPSRPVALYWIAILLAAAVFAAGHLPAMALESSLTPPVIWRTLALNAVPGAVFGWFYWRRSLEHAMLAHMGAHLGMWLAAPFT